MYAAVLLPDFELQCALRAASELDLMPTALIGEVGGGAGVPMVRQVNVAARSAEVGPGMSLPQAQARCAELVFLRRDEGQEAIATTALHQAAERISPYLENTLPGCCTLDLRRHGELDHDAWARDLVAELRVLRLDAQVGIAGTPDAALQAAQLAQPVLVTTDTLESLSQLPVLVLDPSERVLEVLCDWGIQRVGDLRGLERQQVGERLGAEGLALWDRASGGDLRPLRLIRVAETYEELAEFEGGVETLEPILFRLRRSLEQLQRRLRADWLLAGAILIVIDLDNRKALRRTIQLPVPTCDVDVLERVLSAHLDTITTDSPVVAFRLQAFPSTPRDHQAHLWEGSVRDPNKLSETLARLEGIVGPDRLGTPQRLSTHRPNSFHLLAPDLDGSTGRDGPVRRLEPSINQPPVFPAIGLSLRRYRPPFRIDVKTEHCRPVWMRGKDVEAGLRSCAGPWRLDGDWWEEKKEWRWEEWDVEPTAGGLYRLANHRQANWWMLGMYD